MSGTAQTQLQHALDVILAHEAPYRTHEEDR